MKNLIKNFWAHALLTLIVLYLLKGFLYPTGTLSLLIATAELLICFIMGCLALKWKQRSYLINFLYIFFLIVFIVYLISPKILHTAAGSISTFAFFRNFCGALLPCFAMYFLVRKDKVSEKWLNAFFYAYFISAIIAFFFETISLIVEKNGDNLTSNSAYRFVYLMPFIVFLKGDLKILLLWIIAFLITLLSVKRGAILVISLECIVYYCTQFWRSNNKGLYFVIAVIISAIGWHFLYQYYLDNPYLQMRVDATLQGSTSGRDYLANKLLEYVSEESLLEFIFGSGFANTANIAGNYAHSDWIESFVDFGVIGLIVYVSIFFFLVRTIINAKAKNSKTLLLLFVAFFPTSFFSMVFFSESSSIGFLWLGLIMGRLDSQKYGYNTTNSA